jgi:hypothetical protein
MSRATGCLLKTVGLIVAILTGAAIGLLVSLRAFDAWWSSGTHAWEPVPLPGGRQADHFVIGEDQYVYAQSNSSVVFVQQPGLTDWTPEGDFTPQSNPPYGRCDPQGLEAASAWEDRPPGTIEQALLCEYSTSAETGFTVRYLILSDGVIWRQYVEGVHGQAAMIAMIGFPLVGLVGGALVGCSVYGLILLLRRLMGREND